jgi:hypothetical protein
MLRRILSKSNFMFECPCPGRRWFSKNLPEIRYEAEETQRTIFQSGTDINTPGKAFFSGGVDASHEDAFHYQQSVADTALFISEGKTVNYEAAFQYNGLLCAVDLLVKWNANRYVYEARSIAKVKSPFSKNT